MSKHNVGVWSEVRSWVRAAVVLLPWTFAVSAWSAEPIPPVFENALIRYVMTRTVPGTKILSQVTSTEFSLVTESTYSAFLQRMAWQQNGILREKLGEEFQGLTRSFGEFRQQNGRAAEIQAGEVLGAQDKEFLEQWGNRVFRNNEMADLLVETRNFFVVPAKAPKASEEARRAIAEGLNIAYSGPGEVPKLPTAQLAQLESQANAGTPTLRDFDRMFWTKIGDRFRAYRMYFDVLKISDGEWRSLYTLSGRTFTANDLELIRKANRLIDVLNNYSRTRLIMRAFTQESPQVYDLLNQKTADATRDFLNGVMSESDYLAARAKIAGELKMNTIVPEAEKRMLQSVRRLKELGGGMIGGAQRRSQIDLSEDNIERFGQESAQATEWAARIEQKIAEIDGQLRTAASDQKAALLQSRHSYEQSLLREKADAALAISRQRSEADVLAKMYIEFIESYDSLELFVNLRMGRITSEEVQVFNVPDSLVPSAHEVQQWKNFYDKALSNSTNALVIGEVGEFYASHAGATRKFIVSMNDMTGKYFGKKFTESPFGREFLQYNKTLVRVWAERLLVLVGLASPAAAKEFFDRTDVKENFIDPLVQKLWEAMFHSDDPNAAAAPSTPSSGTRPSGPGSGPTAPATGGNAGATSSGTGGASSSGSGTAPSSGQQAGEKKDDASSSDELPPPPSGGPAGGRRIVIGMPHSGGINPPKPTEAPDESSSDVKNPEDRYQ